MESTKRKLLFDYYSGDTLQAGRNGAFKRKIEKLKQNKVKTVFIITSQEVLLEPYLELIDLYEESGFIVNSINIEALDDEHLLFVRNAVEDINASFRKGSCLIVSFGDSVAGPLLASFYIYSGRNLRDALDKVRLINESLIRSDEEIAFLQRFQKYIGIAEENELEIPELSHQYTETGMPGIEEGLKKDINYLERKDSEKERIEEEKIKEIKSERGKELIREKVRDKEAKYETEEGEEIERLPDMKGFGRFYSSIRFKLISITSVIIVISLSGMILLASYFFKRDNTVRVQENNLKLSEVVALKVESDFQAIIDKSKLIANTLMQNISKKDMDYYSKLMLNNDRDFIFFGMAVPSKGDRLNLIKKIYNNPLIEENRVSKNNIEAVHRLNRDNISESFQGEIVVYNISRQLQIPAIGLSLPFHKDINGRVQSILICYLKLDRFLPAFQTSGVTKTFMVDSKGDILAHSDSAVILGGGNYMNLPIVKFMITNALPNGQKRYADENGIYHLGSFKKIGIGGIGVIATVEEDIVYQEVYNQQKRDIYLTAIVLTVVILIIFFFGKTLTTPIIRLLSATKRIKDGDYRVKIRPAFRDEIGELTYSFIEMGRGLEEREKIKTAFGKFVNPELAEMVTKNEVKLGGERKTVAVMFSDIRNFTAISERLQPEEVVDFLNAYMTRMVECIDRTRGIVDKFIGDAIMAEWGVPVSRGNDTENAVNSALMMRKVLIEFNKNRRDTNRPIIKIGCGINTGIVLAGQIGSEDRMEYTVIGDTVNLASRIEELNKPFGTDILISQDSYEFVKNIFAVERMSPIRVKGKEEAQQIYAVLGRLDDSVRPRNLQELRDVLGTKEQPFKRRREDAQEIEEIEKKDIIEEEVKYEVLV